MADCHPLDDSIAKLREMEEELAMARLEASGQTLLASRIRRLTILADEVRAALEKTKRAA